MTKTLNQLLCGECAQIERLDGCDRMCQRLMAMAFVPGSSVEVLGVAPLGDPIAVKLCDTRVCIRKEDAANVVVTL